MMKELICDDNISPKCFFSLFLLECPMEVIVLLAKDNVINILLDCSVK